jgi:hypothetical protein
MRRPWALPWGYGFHLDMFHFDPVPLGLGQVETKISPYSRLRLSRLRLDSGLRLARDNKWEACQVLTKSRFAPNEPLPHFLTGRVDEYALTVRAEEDEPRESILVLNAGILVMTTALISIAITLSWGNPAKVFTDIKAAVIDNSGARPDAVQATRSIRTSANSQVLLPAVTAAPSREESSPAVDSAGQNQAAATALLGQFQAWATTQDEPAQNGTAQSGLAQSGLAQSGLAQDGPAQDRSAQDGSIYVARAQPADDDRAEAQPVRPREVAPAQDAQDDDAPVRTVRRHRIIGPVHNARAEMRSARALAHRLARARQDRLARAQARPVQQARAPEQPAQPVQPAQPPSLMQSFGWQQQ